MRDVLIRPHDHHAAALAIDAPQGENIMAGLRIGAEDLLVVDKSVASLPRQKQRWHRLDGEIAMILLENASDIDHRVDILARRGVFLHRRLASLGEKVAQSPDAGIAHAHIACSREDEDAEAPVRLDRVTELDRLGVR